MSVSQNSEVAQSIHGKLTEVDLKITLSDTIQGNRSQLSDYDSGFKCPISHVLRRLLVEGVRVHCGPFNITLIYHINNTIQYESLVINEPLLMQWLKDWFYNQQVYPINTKISVPVSLLK